MNDNVQVIHNRKRILTVEHCWQKGFFDFYFSAHNFVLVNTFKIQKLIKVMDEEQK